MTIQDNITSLKQVKLEALSAIYLHEKRLYKLQKRNLLVEFLSIAVPTFYIVPRYLLKGSMMEATVDTAGELLAIALLILAIGKIVYKWQESETKHAVMARRNADIKNEAEQLLAKKTLSQELLFQFMKRVSDVDEEDREHLLGVTHEEDQEAYRDALKKLTPGATTCCMKCGADPWRFRPGPCSVCGGTPLV